MGSSFIEREMNEVVPGERLFAVPASKATTRMQEARDEVLHPEGPSGKMPTTAQDVTTSSGEAGGPGFETMEAIWRKAQEDCTDAELTGVDQTLAEVCGAARAAHMPTGGNRQDAARVLS